MPEPDQLSPEEIAQVRQLLNQRGMTTVMEPQKVQALPSGMELVGKQLHKLGKVGRYLVWVLKCGAVIYGILMVPVDCCDLIEFYRPKTHAVVEQVAAIIEKMKASDPTTDVPLDQQVKYVGFNPDWRRMPDGILDTFPIQESTTTTPPPDILITTSNTPYGIISGSGIVRGLV